MGWYLAYTPISPARDVTSKLSPMDSQFVVEHDEDINEKRGRLGFGAKVDTPTILETGHPNGNCSKSYIVSFSFFYVHSIIESTFDC